MTYAGKVLTAYRLLNGVQTEVNTWKMLEIKADTELGFLSQWEDKDGLMTYVGHAPVEISNRCFLWHNHHSGYEFTDRYGSPSLRLSMSIRTAKHPEARLEGVTYLVEECKLGLLGIR